MNMAKWLLLAILALPLMELAAFMAVAVSIGLLWALVLVAAGSMAGIWLLRRAGGAHIARIRTIMGQGNIAAISADGAGGLVLLAGVLLAIPGFITDVFALLIMAAALRRGGLDLFSTAAPPPGDGVVDLAPDQWRQVPDPALEKRAGESLRRSEE
jgi:UPF0716 protein FxsA